MTVQEAARARIKNIDGDFIETKRFLDGVNRLFAG
jgi:hypothetical protein